MDMMPKDEAERLMWLGLGHMVAHTLNDQVNAGHMTVAEAVEAGQADVLARISQVEGRTRVYLDLPGGQVLLSTVQPWVS